MAPAQAIIGLDNEDKPEIGREILLPKVNRNHCADQSGFLDIICDKNLQCTDNLVSDELYMGNLSDQCEIDEESDSVIDILECEDGGERLGHNVDTTESSSSFGDTVSGSDDGCNLNSSDAEVESQFCGENGASNVFHRSNNVFRMRKKKLTDDWKKYISSVRWRCHWLELKMNEVLSQASKYDKFLSECSHRKQLKYTQAESGSCASRSVPLSCQSHKLHARNRRRRKRTEETVDVHSYMSSHILFSYYEKKRAEVDGAFVDNDSSFPHEEQEMNSGNEFGGSCEWPILEFRDGDSSSEQVFCSIEGLHSRVLKLKTQLNKLMSRNAGKFSSTENLGLCLTADLTASSAPSPDFSPVSLDENPVGSFFTPCQNLTEYETGDLVMPESAVSSYGDPALPDLIDNTMGLLSDPGIPLDQPHIGDSCKDMVDVLIQNQASEEDLQDYEVGQPIQKPCEGVVKEEEEERESDIPAVSAPDPSILRFCLLSDFHIPKSKRKRTGPRSGLGGWNVNFFNRRFPDKQDNQ